MKVSCLVLESTATPAPRAVLRRNRFVPILLKTAYPAAFRISSLDVGWSLYKSSSVDAAILRVLSLFLLGESLAIARHPLNNVTTRTDTIVLTLMNAPYRVADGGSASPNVELRGSVKRFKVRTVVRLFLFVFRWYRGPGFVRVESLHALKFIETLRPEILFVDNAVVADDEGSHSGYAIFRRRGHKGKASDHYSFHDEVQFAERGCRALPFENLEEIAVIGLAAAVALFDGAGDLVPYWTSPCAIWILPR